MKSDSALIPLSRKHHPILLFARLLQEGTPTYKCLPSKPEEKAMNATLFCQIQLITYFIDKETVLVNAKLETRSLNMLA